MEHNNETNYFKNISNDDILKQSLKDEPKISVEIIEAKERALKSMKYLLGISEKYSYFFQSKIQDKVFAEEGSSNNNEQNKENEIDAESTLKKNKYFTGNLRPYQVSGVKWLMTLFENAMNGILADEMGLGKTIQIIALISNLIEKGVNGPYLIIAPLSTLPNWEREFSRFASKIPMILFQGSADERNLIKQQIRKTYYLDDQQVKPVIITSYNMILLEEKFLGSFSWKYIIVDEGHRLKNAQSKLFQKLIEYKTQNKVLLTGTPIQNNLTELWSLLHFLMPQIFNKIETFSTLFALEDLEDKQKLIKEEEKNNIISTIHKVLAPFMLRRLKKDVMEDLVPKKEVVLYCPLSKIQIELYIKAINHKDAPYDKIIEPLNKKRRIIKKTFEVESDRYMKKQSEAEVTEENDDVIKYYDISKNQNSMMMYKKIVNHPYLVRFPIRPGTKTEMLINEDLIKESGKMMVLDVMLPKLQKQGHRVLIFSTLVIMLDLIEEYMILRGFKYRRLDGKMQLQFRGEAIQDFNSDPEIFVFLISTRAGGLGLNLVTADTVILFDRDWNPQADNQAQDRCHRIGQTKPVAVYTLITKNTIDERILKYGNMKKRLEKIVIKDGKYRSLNKTIIEDGKLDLVELQKILEIKDDSKIVPNNGLFYSDAELDKLLDRSDMYQQMENNNKENVIDSYKC